MTGSDLSGIDRVLFQLDGITFAEDIRSDDGFTTPWDIEPLSDGAHTLTLIAYDTLGNESPHPP